jgi:cytosine/uracil/thiamine/allantoin permease
MYWRSGGISWPAIIAQVVGMLAAIEGLSATFKLPNWLNEITFHTHDSFGYGADFSVFLGVGVGGLLYFVLGYSGVKKQKAAQDVLLGVAA